MDFLPARPKSFKNSGLLAAMIFHVEWLAISSSTAGQGFHCWNKKSTFIHRHRCDHHWRNQWLLTVFSIPGKIYGQMAGCFSGMLTLELITACNARFFPRVSSSIPSWGYFFRVMLRRLWHTSVFFQHRKALTDPQISHSDRPSFFGMGT